MNIQVIKSNRKSIAIEIKPDLTVIVRAPRRMSKWEIERFVREHEDWIQKHLEIVRKRKEKQESLPQKDKLTPDELKVLVNMAREAIPERVAYYAPIVGVAYGRIAIRNQKTRWGSCSGKGNLNFNCQLMRMPPEVIDYVVVHELCHRKEMNHSPKFWAEVERVLPDYKSRRKWLKENGHLA